jgi:hypothetical protein
MNNRSLWRALAIAVLVIAGAAFLSIGAYNAGVAHGIADSGRAITSPPAGTPYVYIWPRPWGFGFFPFFPILTMLFLFFVVRALLWRGPGRGGWACRDNGVPPAFEEWHRRAHGEQPRPTPTAGGST